MSDFWHGLPPLAQDAVLLVALLVPAALIGGAVVRGFRPWPLVRAMLWRFRWANAMFVALIAISLGMGIGLLAQERGLRRGTAQAADKFDLVISAPGSEITMLMAAVYLQPSDVPLVSGEVYAEVAGHEHVSLAAPLAFGDSFGAAPVVGTTAAFVAHLSDGEIEGRNFATEREAVIGARVPLALGDEFQPAHGQPSHDEHDEHDHEGHVHDDHLTVVGRIAATGTPWDRAIMTPVESVWSVHGLANGHAPERRHRIGPPFDPDYFPGTPAIIVRAEALWANYALRSEFTRDAQTMAFFPGAVLAQLHRVMGDVRAAMSLMSMITQALVAAGVIIGLLILSRLFVRQMSLLRAIGAPDRFVFAVVWCYGAVLLGAGAALGALLGQGAAMALSQVVTARTSILVQSPIGWAEYDFLAGFVSLASLLSLLPAVAALRTPITEGMRA